MRNSIIAGARALLPAPLRSWIVALQRRYRLQWPRTGAVNFGDLQRLTPISPVFGLDRGQPIDRYYIEQFLSARSADVRGRVLEFGDDSYTRKFGSDRVTHSDVLHNVPGNPRATIVTDLTCAEDIASETFDCIIATQTLQMIYDLRAALRHLQRILRPNGVLLMTSHGISRIGRHEQVDPWGEYWRLTTQSARRLFLECFSAGNLEIKAYGNVLSAITALHGLASDELRVAELDYHDPNYEVIVGVRAVKTSAPLTNPNCPTASL